MAIANFQAVILRFFFFEKVDGKLNPSLPLSHQNPADFDVHFVVFDEGNY